MLQVWLSPAPPGDRTEKQPTKDPNNNTHMLSCCLQQGPSAYTGAVYSCEAAGVNLNTSSVCCGKGGAGQGHYPHHLTLLWTCHQKGLKRHTSIFFVFPTPLPIFADCHCHQCTGLLWTINTAYLSGWILRGICGDPQGQSETQSLFVSLTMARAEWIQGFLFHVHCWCLHEFGCSICVGSKCI